MPHLSPEQEALLLSRQRANHYTIPPNLMMGIGQPVAAAVPAALGGLRLSAPTTFTLDIIAKTIDFFDVLYPDVNVVGFNPEGLLPSVANSEVVIANDGVYIIDIIMIVAIDGLSDYALEILVNGNPTGAAIAIDTSKNNVNEVNVSTTAVLNNLKSGDAISIAGTATINSSQFDPVQAGLFVNRLR